MALETQYIVVMVEDRPGVMQKVTGLIRRRDFNIDSITVGYSHMEGISRITLAIKGDRNILDQVIKQLYKLVEVIKVSGLNEELSVIRELALLRVTTASEDQRAEIVQYANIFRASIVDVRKESVIVEITGRDGKVAAFIDLMKPYGIKEIARTGKTIISRKG